MYIIKWQKGKTFFDKDSFCFTAILYKTILFLEKIFLKNDNANIGMIYCHFLHIK